MGEIGIQRKEFLYELQYIDLLLISRGYFCRYHPMYDAARLIMHQVHYCMGVPKGGIVKLPKELVTFSWEKEKSLPVSDEDIEQMRREIRQENEARAAAK